MVKAIIFDIGGVLLDLDLERCLKSFREDCGLDRIGEFLDPCHQRGPICELEAGSISVREFYDKMKTLSRPGTTDEQIKLSFWALLRSIPKEKVELILDLKKKYDLYLLSNNNPITMEYTAAEFARLGLPFESTFKGVYISSEMKLLKPGREIFDEVVRRSGHKAEEMLFIDDSPTNVEGAKKAGLQSLYYKVGTSLRDTLETVNL